MQEVTADEERTEWTRAAFIGWQNYAIQPRDKGRSPMSLRAWLDQFGLGYQKGHADLSPDEAKTLKHEALAKAEWVKSLDTRREVRPA